MPNRAFDFIGPFYDWIIRGDPPASLLEYLFLSDSCEEKILEVGAGTGRTAEFLSRFCDSLWLIDPSVQMLNIARRKLPNVKITHGYVEDLPFSNNFFNRILAIDSLHHWDDHKQGLLEIFRVLKPNGFFVLIEFDPRSRFGHFIKSMERVLRMGSKFFTPREMRYLHRTVGFEIVNQKHIDSGTYITVSSPAIKKY
jgi:ubiquinone/menaquinone biosynthesis C-methylase UbiE